MASISDFVSSAFQRIREAVAPEVVEEPQLEIPNAGIDLSESSFDPSSVANLSRAPSLEPTGDPLPDLEGFKRFIFGIHRPSDPSQVRYTGVPEAVPNREIPSGYQAGPYRGDLKGFNDSKFDPNHPEGMTLKMIFARVAEQYSKDDPTAIEKIVADLNEVGIPCKLIEDQWRDKIDFGNGEGAIDVKLQDVNGGQWTWMPEFPDRYTRLGGKSVNEMPPEFLGGADALKWFGKDGLMRSLFGYSSSITSRLDGVSGVGKDAIDLNEVEWRRANEDPTGFVADTPVTSASARDGSINIEFDDSSWRRTGAIGAPMNKNYWMVVQDPKTGQKYGATFDWNPQGRFDKGFGFDELAENTGIRGFHIPQPGEKFWIFVTEPARNGTGSSGSRTPVLEFTA